MKIWCTTADSLPEGDANNNNSSPEVDLDLEEVVSIPKEPSDELGLTMPDDDLGEDDDDEASAEPEHSEGEDEEEEEEDEKEEEEERHTVLVVGGDQVKNKRLSMVQNIIWTFSGLLRGWDYDP